MRVSAVYVLVVRRKTCSGIAYRGDMYALECYVSELIGFQDGRVV